jgi:hypothetical protein
MTTKNSAARRAADAASNPTYTSRGKYGLDEEAPPARATTTDPLAECLTKDVDGKFQRAAMARRAKKRDAITEANITWLREVVGTLSPPLQDVANAWLGMVGAERDGNGSMSWAALAAYLGITVPAAKSRWHRASEQLRQKLPAWRELFPLDAFCDEHDPYATVLDQNSEKRLEGADKFQDDLIESRDEWMERNGCETARRAGALHGELDYTPSRGRYDKYSGRATYTSETPAADDESQFQGLSLKETKGQSRSHGAPRHINTDQRIGSMDRFALEQRRNGYNESRLKEAEARAKAKRSPPGAPWTTSPEEVEFQAAVRAYDDRRGRI